MNALISGLLYYKNRMLQFFHSQKSCWVKEPRTEALPKKRKKKWVNRRKMIIMSFISWRFVFMLLLLNFIGRPNTKNHHLKYVTDQNQQRKKSYRKKMSIDLKRSRSMREKKKQQEMCIAANE